MTSESFADLEVTCASCGGCIEELEDGWVEWLEEGERGERLLGFRVVHNHRRCQYERFEVAGDHHLSHFVGARGLLRLAALIDEREVEGKSFSSLLAALSACIELGLKATPSILENDPEYEAHFAAHQRDEATR